MVRYLGTLKLGGKNCPRQKLLSEGDMSVQLGKLIEQGFQIQEIVSFKFADSKGMHEFGKQSFGFGDCPVSTQQPEIWIRNGASRIETEAKISEFVNERLNFKIVVVGQFAGLEASVSFEWVPEIYC